MRTPEDSKIRVEVQHLLDEVIQVVIQRSWTSPNAKTPTSSNTSIPSPLDGDVLHTPVRNIFTFFSSTKIQEENVTHQAFKSTTEEAMEGIFNHGYDSDGEAGPYTNLDGGHDLDDEFTLPANEPSPLAQAVPAIQGRSHSNFVLIPDTKINTFKVDRLRNELKIRGLNQKGLKKELQTRLKQAMLDEIPIQKEKESEAAQPTVFSDGVYWKLLKPTIPICDPTPQSFHAPTIPEDEASQNIKFNFDCSFDRPPFIAHVHRIAKDKFKRRKINKTSKQYIKNRLLRHKGTPNLEFLLKKGLHHNSLPSDWFEAFVPRSLTDKWTVYTNTKALLANAGQIGKPYPDYKNFSCEELRKHIGIYILHGIAPSPQLQLKFKTQTQNFANGSDFVVRHFGPNIDRRHKHFRRFFTVQDPLLGSRPRQTHPNWKVYVFLEHINSVSRDA